MGVGLGLALDSTLLGISFGVLIGTGLAKLPVPRAGLGADGGRRRAGR